MRASLVNLLMTAPVVLAAPATFYVSTTGSDTSGDGSIGKPWATVARAQQAVRGVTAPGLTSDVYVYLRGGAYFQSAPITFTAADSGNNGFYVHYASYPGDASPAVIHGGVPVTGWKQLNASSNTWIANMPVDTRQLYVNGDRANRTYHSGGLGGTVTVQPWGYTTTDESPLSWPATQNAADVEFLYTGVGSSWTECRCRVASVTPLAGGGSNITMVEPAWTVGVNKFFGQGIGHNPGNIENIYALMDTPGQYYYNSAEKTVVYMARPQDNMQTAAAFAADTNVLLLIQGNRTAQPTVQPVRYLSFENLVFQFAGWTDPSYGNGYIDVQSSFQLIGPNPPQPDTTWQPVPGNIQVHNAWNVSFIGCEFTHLGATALQIDDGSQSVIVANNTFTDVSCGGVLLGQVSDCNTTDASRQNAHLWVYNNLFLNMPSEYHDCAPLLGGFLVNATLEHNSIINASNTGISLGWGWSRDECVNAHDNNIVANYVEGSNWLLEDGGSFYVLGPQRNSFMIENFSNKQVKLFGSLYTDEGSAYWVLDRNVVNLGQEWLHIWISTIHDIFVSNSWTNQAYQTNHGTNCTVVNTTLLSPGQPFPPEAQAIINASGTLGSGAKPLTDVREFMPAPVPTRKCRYCTEP